MAADFGEEGLADSLAAQLGEDEEVFEVDAGVAFPGGVAVEVEGEACGLSLPLGDEAVEALVGAEAVAVEISPRW